MAYNWIHAGNMTKFSLTPKLDKKPHWSKMVGTKAMDKVAFIAKQLELEMMADETVTPDLLAAALLTQARAPVDDVVLYDILGLPYFEKAVKMTGANDFGAKVEIILPRVFFSVDKAMDFIGGEDWMSSALTGDVLVVAGSFGTMEFLGAGASPLPNVANYFIGTGNVYLSDLLTGDTTPTAFTFTDVTGATVDTLYTSNTITIAGINVASPLTITGGEYQIGAGTWASSPTTVVNGNTVKVRRNSSPLANTKVDVVLTIGGVSDTYSITTAP